MKRFLSELHKPSELKHPISIITFKKEPILIDSIIYYMRDIRKLKIIYTQQAIRHCTPSTNTVRHMCIFHLNIWKQLGYILYFIQHKFYFFSFFIIRRILITSSSLKCQYNHLYAFCRIIPIFKIIHQGLKKVIYTIFTNV